VFVHPSRNEGLPTAVLEAAALGLPSVVTRATNVGEVIETYKAGWVIEKTESDALYMAMRLAFNKWEQGNLTALSANAKRMVKEAFDWDLVLQNMRNMYQQCLH
jgi:glycosyltransferase involved in cell wall biosynthesis